MNLKSNVALAAFLDTITDSDIPASIFEIRDINSEGLTVYLWDYMIDELSEEDRKLVRRTLKRVFGPFRVEGEPGMKCLRADAFAGDTSVRVTWYGAVKCEIVSQVKLEEDLSESDISYRQRQLAQLTKEIAEGKRSYTKNVWDCKVKG